MTDRLQHHIALVTGAESGIGAATAVALAGEGCAVAINYLAADDDAQGVRERVQRAGSRAMTVRADVGDEDAVNRMFAAVGAELGVPTILVNNAGRNGESVQVVDMTVAQWDATLRTNLRGAFLCARAFVRERRGKNGPARIVNVSSIHEDVVMLGFADYDASKAALLALTRTLAFEAAPLGMTVNAVAPGMILTAMNREAEADTSVLEERTAHIPLRRAGTVDEIAAAIVYLCTQDASYITGTSIRIDGGLSLNAGQGA